MGELFSFLTSKLVDGYFNVCTVHHLLFLLQQTMYNYISQQHIFI